MSDKTVIIVTLTDDPFAPSGQGSFGGSHSAIFNIGQYLIRNSHRVIFVTRRTSLNHPEFVEFGTKSQLFRIKGGPIELVPYYQVSPYIEEMVSNIRSIIQEIKETESISFLSYNWMSGEVVRRIRKDFSGTHIHLVLALGISRFKAGEGENKISKDWMEFERRTFEDSDHIFCGSLEEKKDLLHFYNKLNSKKIFVLNYGINTNIFFPRPGTKDNYFRRSTQEFQKGINNAF